MGGFFFAKKHWCALKRGVNETTTAFLFLGSGHVHLLNGAVISRGNNKSDALFYEDMSHGIIVLKTWASHSLGDWYENSESLRDRQTTASE